MPSVSLKKLVDTKLAKSKIDPDDAREVLGAVNADTKISAAEVTQLRRLAALPASRFQKKDEFIPNPMDAEEGVTIKADPKRWIENTLQLATATLTLRSTIPELSVSLSKPKTFSDEDFGERQARTLDVTIKGQKASKDGTIDLSYGSRNISVAVKAGASLESVVNRLQTDILEKEGALSIEGNIDPAKSRKQTVKFEVL
jgi:hypothetical protein